MSESLTETECRQLRRRRHSAGHLMLCLERPFPVPGAGRRKIECVSLSDKKRHLEWGSRMTKRGSAQCAPCTLSILRLRPKLATLQERSSFKNITQEPGHQLSTRSLYGHVHLQLCRILVTISIPAKSHVVIHQKLSGYCSAGVFCRTEAPLCSAGF